MPAFIINAVCRVGDLLPVAAAVHQGVFSLAPFEALIIDLSIAEAGCVADWLVACSLLHRLSIAAGYRSSRYGGLPAIEDAIRIAVAY